MALPRYVNARPELDSDALGVYMNDAIERGGYRAALEYCSSEECEKSDPPLYRLRTKGWLLGRLGLYGQMKGWLEEASAWRDFDHLLAAARSWTSAGYRPPPLWLEKPRPVQHSADRIMTLEPVAAPCRDTGAVPDYIWTTMLILDAAGPIFSHAGLGAASFLAGAGAGGLARGDRRYDPRRGARLHGAPEGCHRWIIADIDFHPILPNKPCYYYDLTDEGRGALADARTAGAPWQKATEAAAAGLAGMSIPDLLENACRSSGPLRDLGKMRGELGRLVDAWRAQDDGTDVPPVAAGDQALVDLGLTAKWFDDGETSGSSLDCLLYIMTVIKSTRSVACEAEPSAGAEAAVLQTLIANIQDTCRSHGGAVASTVPRAGPYLSPAHSSPAEQEYGARNLPLYTDAAPPLIGDLYYCLAEYCGSRSLAVDPYSLPLSEVLDEDEKAAAIKVLMDDSVFHHGDD